MLTMALAANGEKMPGEIIPNSMTLEEARICRWHTIAYQMLDFAFSFKDAVAIADIWMRARKEAEEAT